MSGISAKHKEINRNTFSPKLRFVNFSKEWNEISFGDAFDFKQTNSLSRDKLNYEDGKVKNIHYGDIHTKFHSNFYINKENVPYINEDMDLNKIDPENYCKENDLIIADASEDYLDIGKSIEVRNLNNQKVLSGLHTLLARPKSNYFSQGILGYLMRSRTVRLQIMILAQGTKVLGISPKYLNKIIFKLPEILEQQKIAEFLESADSWIENLKEQKKSLEIYKKGMMQKIFAREIRFKDGNGKDFPEWEEKKLEEVCNKKSSSVSANSLDSNEGIYKIYGASGFLKKVDFYKQEKAYISIVKDGAGVGRILLCDPKTSVLGTLDIINPKENINLYFLYLLLSRVNYVKYITGATIPHIYFSDYKKSKLLHPCFQEQQKIAEFLTSIDKVIQSKQLQISQAEKWKKGLMQGLFV